MFVVILPPFRQRAIDAVYNEVTGGFIPARTFLNATPLFYCTIKVYFFQPAATRKYPVAHIPHTVSDCNICQSSTIEECTFT